jgi:hypothetical protein
MPDPRRSRKRRRALGLVHEAGMIGARLAGARYVEFAHPGAAGHERCRAVCLTYS